MSDDYLSIIRKLRTPPTLRNWWGLRCSLGWCGCRAESNDTHCWGQCVECGKRFGVTSREDIRRFLEREANR